MSFKIHAAIILFIAIYVSDATVWDPTQGIVYTYNIAPWDPPNWPGVCQSTTSQSPHLLQSPFIQSTKKIKFFGGVNTEPEEIKIINNGFGVLFKFKYHYLNAPKIYDGPLSSDLYQFDGFSYHVRSEHELNFAPGPAQKLSVVEFQFIHFNLKYETLEEAVDKIDGLAIISVRYAEYLFSNAATSSTFPVPLLSMIGSVYYPFTEVTQQPGRLTYAQILGFDLNNIPTHYSYSGSLTTPPCHESVKWIILRSPNKLFPPDLDVFKNVQFYFTPALQPDNNRPYKPMPKNIFIH